MGSGGTRALVDDVFHALDRDHQRRPPLSGAAAGYSKTWRQPVDYAEGSLHVVLEEKPKPAGDAPTRLQFCFEGTPSDACTVQSPVYTNCMCK